MLSNPDLYTGQTVDIRRINPAMLPTIGGALLGAKRLGVSLGQLCNPPPALELGRCTRLDVFDDRAESLQGRGTPDAITQKLPPLPALKAVTVIASGEPHGGYDVAQAVFMAASPALQVLAVKRRNGFGHHWRCDAASAFFNAQDANGEYLADRIKVLHADIQHEGRIRTPKNLVALFTGSSAWFPHVAEMKNLGHLFVIDAKLVGLDNKIKVLFDAIAKHKVKVTFRRCMLPRKAEFDSLVAEFNKANTAGSEVVVEDSCVFSSEKEVRFSWTFQAPVEEGDTIADKVSDALETRGWSFAAAPQPVSFSFGQTPPDPQPVEANEPAPLSRISWSFAAAPQPASFSLGQAPPDPQPVSFSFGQVQGTTVDFSSIVAPEQEQAPATFSFGGLVAPEPAPFVMNAGSQDSVETPGFSFNFGPQ
jgi:hypothetical protein